MKRYLAALLAASFVSGPLLPAATRADGPFETMPLPQASGRPHRAAYACIAVGAGLAAGSFALARRADRDYDRYLAAQTPNDITHWFDETAHYDRQSSSALLGGEALIAAGIYLRFLRRPSRPIAMLVAPGACAVSFRF